jgi:hypothetical protein
VTDPISAVTTETTFYGATIGASITTTPHTWTAGTDGLFHTATDLKAEWQGFYDKMLAGDAGTLSFVQRLEGNAQAVFLNTKLNTLDAATQARDREDVQREYDAVAATVKALGLDPKAALSEQDYLRIEHSLQGNASLEELAMQGRGLNSPSQPKYNGYTNDFQNGVDGTTLYVGGGLDNNENALTAFMDDVVLSHLPFPTIAQNGHLEQLNQNGDSEDTLTNAAGALDQAGAVRVYTAADFSQVAGTASGTPAAPPGATVTVPAGQMLSLTGFLVPTTIVANGHTWTANSNGLYTTTTDLAAEWKGYYQQMLAGNGASLTATQRLEGNAEAVFENTGLASVAQNNPIQIALDRQDLQREADAIVAEDILLGIDPNKPLTQADYLALEHGLQANAALEELAVQGHGLNSPPNARYNGYTNDFQNNVDQRTLYIGPGMDTGERAIADLFDDGIMTHVPFPTVAQNGELEQLNQNGASESTVQYAVAGMNQFRFGQVLKASDFDRPGQPANGVEPVAGTTTTFFGATIASTMTAGAHTWTVGADGKFHTTTDLTTEWKGYYATMLAGNGAALTAIQRLEGNAEAVFDNTSLSNLKLHGTAQQQSFREDAQREFDAISVAMSRLGLGGALLNAQDYLHIGAAIQSDAALGELAMQGHGLNNPSLAKYNGYTNDFQNNSDNTTLYVGGAGDNGEKAVAAFFDDVILTHLPFPVVGQNGGLEQLNQNANAEDSLATVVADTNDAMFRRVYVAGDFSKSAAVAGPVVYVSAAAATAVAPAAPVPGAGQMLSYTGAVVPTTLTVAGDTWVADSAGRYETATDLNLQWYNSYQAALAGKTLTLRQHWQAEAEAVFENTGLSKLGEGQQQQDRADLQREMDAVLAVMGTLGLGASALTAADYLSIEHALQGNAALQELAVQGHGLNSPWVAGQTKYLGYTNDFQHNVDNKTLFVGGGVDNGERAIADFFDDAIMTHLPFPSVAQNGEPTQLNQNGNNESTVLAATALLNQTLFGRVLTSADFLVPGRQAAPAPAAGPATVTAYSGDTIAATVTVNGHTWVADANGVFQTTANLQMEWRTDYQTMLAGHGDTLTAAQRMAGNAEAVFENTNINGLWQGAAKEAQYRADVQREIDAIAGAMAIDKASYGIDPNAALTEASYLQLGTTLQSNVALEELALQGHGVQNPPSVRYKGAYGDFMAGADWSTYFVGGGPGNGTLALPYAFDNVISNLPFAAVFQNGAWQQTDRNGNVAASVLAAAAALNNTMYRQVFVASDFSASKTAVGAVVLVPGAASATVAPISAIAAAAGSVVTLTGRQIAGTMTANGHTWTADANGLFHTANLEAEWKADYAAMLAGQGGTLTALQRMEGNAEAVLEATGATKLSAAQQQALREDAQRQIDAMAINAATLGIPTQAVLLTGSYAALERTLHANAALEELAVQGTGLSATGLSGKAAIRYRGLAGDTAGLSSVKYVGGGLNNGKNGLSTFLQQDVLGLTPFAIVWHNGKLVQLDQNGQLLLQVSDAAATMDDSMFYRVYKASDFHK